MLGALKISASAHVPDGTQVWMQGREVVDITTHEQAAFYAMFGLMRVPSLAADGVVLSTADYQAFAVSAKRATP